MQYDDQMKNRIKRIEGQLRGILKMMEENKDCRRLSPNYPLRVRRSTEPLALSSAPTWWIVYGRPKRMVRIRRSLCRMPLICSLRADKGLGTERESAAC